MTVEVLGYRVSTVAADKCSDQIVEHLVSGLGLRWFACLNAHSWVVAKERAEFGVALNQANWLVADGVGIVLASIILRRRRISRCTGPDVFLGVNSRLDVLGTFSVYFLGSSPENLSRLCSRFVSDFPNVRIAGAYSPPYQSKFSEEENAKILAMIQASGADVLWVALTAPKQELWIAQNANRLDVKFAGAVGAVFDYYTERMRRAPLWARKAGFEWLFRLMSDPRRMLGRVLRSGPIFLVVVLRGYMISLARRHSRDG